MLLDETDNIQSAQDKEGNDFLKMTKMHFEGRDDQETTRRSKKFKTQMRLKQDWSPISHLLPQISDQYGSYSHYKKTFPKLKDTYQQDTRAKLGQNQKKFIQKQDIRSQEKIHAYRPKNGDNFQIAYELEERNEEDNDTTTLATRKVLFPDMESPLPVTEEFLSRDIKSTLEEKIDTKEMEEDKLESEPWEGAARTINFKKLPKNFTQHSKKTKITDGLGGEEGFEGDGEEGEEGVFQTQGFRKNDGEKNEDDREEEDDDEEDEEEEEDEEGEERKKNEEGGDGEKSKGIRRSKNMKLAKSEEFSHPYLNEYDEMVKKIEWETDDEEEKEDEEDFKMPDSDEESDIDPTEDIFGRVSPWAKEEIFRLYLEGWSIRDLSIRFGILPERAKAIIWCRKQFYDEIFPRLDIKTVRLGIEREMMYGMYYPWIDYGLDLETLIEREKGVPLMNFRNSNVPIDPKAEEDRERKLNRILEQKTKKKQDKVTEGFVGTGNKGYFLKSWIVYKGHGSERVNRGFKKALHFSEKKERLSHNMRKKIKNGPREVGFSQGIK